MQTNTAEKLPTSIIGKAIVFPFTHLWTLLKIALVPWLISYAFLYGLAYYFTAGNITDFSPLVVLESLDKNVVAQILKRLVDAFVITIVAVGIHRVIISNEKPSWTIIRLRRNEIAYMAVSVIIFLIFMFPQYIIIIAHYFLEPSSTKNITLHVLTLLHPFTFTALSTDVSFLPLLYAVICFIFAYFSITFSMAFPRAAITGRVELKNAWSILDKHVVKFFMLLILFGVSLIIVGLPAYLPARLKDVHYFIEKLPYFPVIEYSAKLLGYVYPISELLVFSMTVAFISYCYANLTGGKVAGSQTSSSI